jgi:hypothetical protein
VSAVKSDFKDGLPFGGSNDMKVDQVQPDDQDDVEDNSGVENDVEEFAVGEFIIHFVVHDQSRLMVQSMTSVMSLWARSDWRINLHTGFSIRFKAI